MTDILSRISWPAAICFLGLCGLVAYGWSVSPKTVEHLLVSVSTVLVGAGAAQAHKMVRPAAKSDEGGS